MPTMKRKILLFLAVIAIMSLQSCKEKPMKISIFVDHIEQIASQNQISFRQAAILVRNMGYQGIDCKYQVDPEHLRILDSLGFYHVIAIAHINITEADHQEDLDKALDFMKNNNFKSILLVPGLFQTEPTNEELSLLAERWRNFTDKAENMGFKVVAEDFDNTQSPIFNAAGLDWAFNEVPKLGCAFDLGNFLYAGDDVMEAFEHFRPRIVHMHLKDRPEVRSKAFANVGYGIAPIKECIMQLKKSGYKGWYVVELYGSRDVLSDARTSINYLLNDKDMNP